MTRKKKRIRTKRKNVVSEIFHQIDDDILAWNLDLDFDTLREWKMGKKPG